MDKKNLLKILSDLVSFETVYPNTQEFSRCVEYIKSYFKNSPLYIEEFEYNGSKSLVIANHRTTQFDIIFCGHIDVVAAPKSLFTVKEDGDIVYGRGVADMKGQVAVMMQIMEDLAQEPSEKKVALFLTSDEERGGFDGVNNLLGTLDYSSNVAIAPDGGFDYTLVAEAKGVLQIKLTTSGVAGHSSEPWKGVNAIEKLFAILKQIFSEYQNPKDHLDWKTSFNISKIEGGDSVNKVPNSASVYIDIRHTHFDTPESLIGFIKSIDESIIIEVLAHGDAFKLDKDNRYVKAYIDVCQAMLGKNIDIIKCHTASDARFFTRKNIPCLVMNPIGGDIHSNDEWVNLESLSTLGKIYKQYLNKLP